MWRPPARPAIIATIAFAALCCSSCSKGKQFYPVHGRLLVNGKPAPGVNMVLFAVEESDPTKPLQPTAVVQEDGSFEFKTFVNQDRTLKDGAPAGHYNISCVWYPPDLQKYLTAMVALPDRLHGKYADPKTSGLKAEVLEQPTDLQTIELTVPPG